MSAWNQPICAACWSERHPGRRPVTLKLEFRDRERCAYCGEEHCSGIYVRDHPDAVPYPPTITVELTLAEATALTTSESYHGDARNSEQHRLATGAVLVAMDETICRRCRGSGHVDRWYEDHRQCPDCDGSGAARSDEEEPDG